jgi:hypothetical protein
MYHGLEIIVYFVVFSVCMHLIRNSYALSQINLENSNKALLELQENYRIAISTLKEKEQIISKLLYSGKAIKIFVD